MLKLMMRFSVLRTVLKFRFSRVRKYFWLRVMVDSWPEIFQIDSSRADVCSGDVPCFAGKLTRASFSTCSSTAVSMVDKGDDRLCDVGGKGSMTDRNLEVDEFLGERAHLVVEAELVLARHSRGEDKVSLPLLLSLQNYLAEWPSHLIVDIERTA